MVGRLVFSVVTSLIALNRISQAGFRIEHSPRRHDLSVVRDLHALHSGKDGSHDRRDAVLALGLLVSQGWLGNKSLE
jgi:hypothetical protein